MDSHNIVSEERGSWARLYEARKALACYLTQPVVQLLARTPIVPNAMTWFGFLVTLGAAALIIAGYLFAAGLVVLVAGFFDILDGSLARSTNRTTHFGAVLDSTLDRLGEAVVLLGVLLFYISGSFVFGILLTAITLPASFLVSYIRARAESLGVECQVGFFTRAERVIVLTLGLLLSQIDGAFLVAALGIIVFFSIITIGHRLLHVWRQTKIS